MLPHGVSHIDQRDFLFEDSCGEGKKAGWPPIYGQSATMLSDSGGSEGKMEAEGKMNGCREKERG